MWIKRIILFLAFAFALLYSTGCKKQDLFGKGNLTFSTDTLVFDTVFTTIGSTTLHFKFYNNSNEPLLVDEIELMGGSSSPFRMNVDGEKGTRIQRVEMERRDSLFVFVEVTLQVNGGTLPMVVEDRIRFRTNGKDQFVQLAVWGQDAYFHRNDINSGTWPNDKPHVIYGFAGIDSAQTLTIQPGTQVYLHKNSLLYNYKGTLNILGTKDERVTFQGDRLESFYDDVPGQFYGIYFQEARPSIIDYLVLKNGIAGIHLFSRDNSFNDYTLKLTNSEIHNNSRYGCFLYSGARVQAENCLIYNNSLHALLVLEGGAFNFNHCHLLNYANGSKTPAVGISNYFLDASKGQLNLGTITEGTITNSIISGNQETELVLDTLDNNGQSLWQFKFDHCLILKKDDREASYYNSIIWNQNPNFSNVREGDLDVPGNSPILNVASNLYFVPFDINGVARNVSGSDLGALEFP